MSCITVREHLFVNTVSADTVHILCRIFLHFLQCFLDAVNDHRTFYLIIPLPVITMLVLFFRGSPFGKDSSVFLPITTTFPVVSSRNIFISAGILTRSSLFLPIPQFLSAATIIFILSSFSLCNYTAMGIFLICGHVS